MMSESDGNITDVSEEDLIYINVCGMLYITLKSTLERYPLTLLGSEENRSFFYVESKKAYFFDRHRQSFEAILYYYQSHGQLNRPQNIPFGIFAEEVSFFGLGQEAFFDLEKREGYIHEEIEEPKELWKRKIWELFDAPISSKPARVVSCWSVFVIVVSISTYCMETMPRFRQNNSVSTQRLSQSHIQPWFSLELGCFIWFTIEYILRFISAPNRLKFMRSFLNVIDVIAILPFFITLLVNSELIIPLPVLRVVWLVRVFRIFKLSRHSKRLQILGHTLKASISELCMLIFFLIIGIILFSSALFCVERGESNDQFQSIPDTFWYSVVTMTTVGYGDKTPVTLGGKLIGSLCAVTGVLAIALPVPVIVSNFEFFYKRDRFTNEQKKFTTNKERCVGASSSSPKINSPRTSGMNSPRINLPSMNSPSMNSPRMNSPKMNSPRTNDKSGNNSK